MGPNMGPGGHIGPNMGPGGMVDPMDNGSDPRGRPGLLGPAPNIFNGPGGMGGQSMGQGMNHGMGPMGMGQDMHPGMNQNMNQGYMNQMGPNGGYYGPQDREILGAGIGSWGIHGGGGNMPGVSSNDPR